MEKAKSILLIEEDPIVELYLARCIEGSSHSIYAIHDSIFEAIVSIEKGQSTPDILMLSVTGRKQEKQLKDINIFMFLYPVKLIIMSSAQDFEWMALNTDLSSFILLKPFSEVQFFNALAKA